MAKQNFKAALNADHRQEISWQTITSKREQDIQMNENKNMAGQHCNGGVKFDSTKYLLPVLFGVKFIGNRKRLKSRRNLSSLAVFVMKMRIIMCCKAVNNVQRSRMVFGVYLFRSRASYATNGRSRPMTWGRSRYIQHCTMIMNTGNGKKWEWPQKTITPHLDYLPILESAR